MKFRFHRLTTSTCDECWRDKPWTHWKAFGAHNLYSIGGNVPTRQKYVRPPSDAAGFEILWCPAGGARPGVFVLGTTEDDIQKHYLNLYKMGEGPLYCFYRPFHLCHIEVPSTIARAVLLSDATVAPQGAPTVEVISTAKIDLEAGQTLDGLGCYTLYGQCENALTARAERLLPFGVAEGCKVKRNIARDEVLTYDDVELPKGRLIDKLRVEQDALFSA